MTRYRYDRTGERVEVEDDPHTQRDPRPRRCDCDNGWTQGKDGDPVPCLVCCHAGVAAARAALHHARRLREVPAT